MRTKVTLVLVFLNVALFFFIFKFERAWRTEAALQEARRRVLGSETADIRSLTVSSSTPGGPSFTLVRNRDVWMLTRPLDWPANQPAVTRIIHELQFLQDETSFNVADLARNGQSLADYGLAHPKLTLSFTSGGGDAPLAPGQMASGPTTVVRIGDSTKVGDRVYVLSPDGRRIHVVGRSLVDALTVPLDQLRADTLLTIPVFEARALSVQTSGARVRIRRDGSQWLFDTIVNARASKTEMDLMINALDGLRAKSFPATPPATLPSAAPSLRVTIDGNNRSETLLLGEPVQGAAAAAAEATAPRGRTEYYAQLMNGNNTRSPVFTVMVGNAMLEHLSKAQDFLRERRILAFDPAAVTAITLSAPSRPTVALQRLDPNSAQSAWQVVRRGDGNAAAQTLPADAAAVRGLIDELALLSANQFVSDAPSLPQLEAWGFNRPEREITISAASPGAAATPTILELGTDAKGAVYARVGTDPGASVYAVTIDLGHDLPVDVRAWRDRTVRDLPSTARIAALRLTDLADHHVVFEATFDQNGKPAKPVRDPAAVEHLLAGVRTLRAKSFVQDGFPEHLVFAGEERPWRYRLDATIALPGGAGAEQTSTSTLYLTQRLGGAEQIAGSKEFNAVFELQQPVVDALWSLTYGPRDPGPPAEKK